MTILVDARPLVDPTAGGVGRVAAGLLPALVDAMPNEKFIFLTTGFNVRAHGMRPPIDRHEGARGAPLHEHVRWPNKILSLACLLSITSFDRWTRDKPDLLFFPNVGWIGQPKIPYILVVHDISFLIEPRWFNFKSRWWHRAIGAERQIKNAQHLFAVSERTKKDLMELLGIPSKRVTVIEIGLDVGAHGMRPPIDRHEGARGAPLPDPLIARRFLLCLGANDPRKNFGCAIAAVNELKRDPKFTDVLLVIVGAGFKPALPAPAPSVGSDPRAGLKPAPTIFLRHPSDDALASLMQHASAFLYPSWYEGFGLPLHEAARFGTPCVASTAGALPETAPHGTLFAPPSKPQLWATALKIILENPKAHRTSTSLADWTNAAEAVKLVLSMKPWAFDT